MQPMPIMHSAPGAEAVIDGRRCLYFAGTAYLGLQGHPEVAEAACEAVRRYGLGAATTRAGFGNQPPVLDVEAAAAKYFGQENAFYYPSGYFGPAIVLAALSDRFDVALVDEQSHYAIHDAVRWSGRRAVRFRHRDASDLRKKSQTELRAGERAMVLCDGVFAASGRVTPVGEYLDVLRPLRGAGLLLDDAHAVGVLGSEGRGTFEHFGVQGTGVNQLKAEGQGTRLYTCATLSKAMGGYGGIVAGDRAFIDKARSASHVFDGCSAPPAAAAAGSAKAIEVLMRHPDLRVKLAGNTRRLREGLLHIGLDLEDDPTPVVAIDLGDAEMMMRVQRRLMDRGIAIGYLKYSGTGEHGALRIAVSAGHSEEMIGKLVGELRGLV